MADRQEIELPRWDLEVQVVSLDFRNEGSIDRSISRYSSPGEEPCILVPWDENPAGGIITCAYLGLHFHI